MENDSAKTGTCKSIRLEILQLNYWEHFKIAKDLARSLHVMHPKRLAIEKALLTILDEINTLTLP